MRSYQRPPLRSTRGKRANPCLAAVFGIFAALCALATGATQQPRGLPPSSGGFSALGSAACRTCHRALYEAWQQSPHASSAATLSFEQSFDAECTPCHVPDAGAFDNAVGCEACHGLGSAYAELDVMIDPLKRRSAGLQDATETCAYCHNPGHAFHVERDLGAAARAIHPR